jgi:hypothetical protein
MKKNKLVASRRFERNKESNKNDTIDWATTDIRQKVLNGKYTFNSHGDPKLFKENELDYMLSMLKYRSKEF